MTKRVPVVSAAIAVAAVLVAALTLHRLYYGDIRAGGAREASIEAQLAAVRGAQEDRDRQIAILMRRQEWVILLLREVAIKVGVRPDALPVADATPTQRHVRGMMDAYAAEWPPPPGPVP